MIENRTVIEQGIKISWHPHPTICLLRWWVSEWESTSIRRERLLALCRGQNGERCSRHSIAEWENRTTFKVDRSGTVEERQGWTDNISKSLSKWSQQRGKSCHLVRKEWIFCSTRQFFKEIAIWWRDFSTLNHEWTASREQSRRSSTEEKQEKIGTGQELYGWDWKEERFASMPLLVLVLLWCLASDKWSVALSSVESLSLIF